jgi:hypothetical protein
MHCPKCGQQQVSNETRFCSRCGMQLAEVAKIVALDGRTPASGKLNSSARVRGLKHGLFFLLTSFLFVPLASIIAIAANADTPIFPAIVLFLTVIGGLLRMAYALLFESGEPESGDAQSDGSRPQRRFGRKQKQAPELNAMPANSAAAPFYSAPDDAYSVPEQGKWRDTNDLTANAPSVTDNTTKLLHQEREN